MRVLFVGGHDLGKRTLQHLINEGITVVAAVETDTDDPWYYGLEEVASKSNIPFIKTKNINAPELVETFKEMDIDVIAVVNFNQIIRKALIAVPTKCVFNVHASLLPHYRGRAPLNWAMIHGEKSVGITIHKIDEGVDTGDILMQREIPIAESDYIGDVLERVASFYPEMVLDVIKQLSEKDIKAVPQNHLDASIYGKRSRQDGQINWNESVNEIRNLIRAVSKPYPGAWTILEGVMYTIWRAEFISRDEELALTKKNSMSLPGTILDNTGEYLFVKCYDGILKLTDYEKVAI